MPTVWRDLLAFGWEFKALHGADKIQSWLSEADHAHTARDFRLEGRPMIGSIGAHSVTLEFFFRFETGIANGRGYARLIAESHAPQLKAFTFTAHLHRPDTVDYVICVAGESDMFLDDPQFTTLRDGDVLIQRGTCHAWANRSDKPAASPLCCSTRRIHFPARKCSPTRLALR